MDSEKFNSVIECLLYDFGLKRVLHEGNPRHGDLLNFYDEFYLSCMSEVDDNIFTLVYTPPGESLYPVDEYFMVKEGKTRLKTIIDSLL